MENIFFAVFGGDFRYFSEIENGHDSLVLIQYLHYKLHGICFLDK